MINIITDTRPGEPDILADNKNKPLIIIDLDQNPICGYPAPRRGGWTTVALQKIGDEFEEGCAYLISGNERIFVGSSEI